MTLRETFNCSFQDSTMNPRSRLQRSHSWRKKDFHKAKVCFADNLETVHEVPYNYDMYNKTNGRLKLPDIDVHKYTPLICRDPYAKPSKRKHEKFADMFVSDTMKLPLIKLRKPRRYQTSHHSRRQIARLQKNFKQLIHCISDIATSC
ncbi:hypothetical protein pdam_00026051 [Pocillopora damicornis]|uniref:Uncharacterized protein n=1 Tax=Pocillopora damicornis TaxID=46731 RepID=A0A3M6UT27_POCDA|nr:hypothetical protein pdam_00026051 [Pocillopora damicornis]